MVTSVITTHKRNPDILLRAINSVLKQTYSDLELIIVDDSPTDYPGREAVKAAIAALNDQRVIYIQHEETKGACAARNTGLKKAKGEYIAFLDDDDEWIAEKIEKQLALFQENNEIALVYCQFMYVNDDSGQESVPNDFFKQFKRGYIFDSLIKYNYVASTSFPLIKTSCLREIGGFDVLMQSCQDYDVWLRLAENYPFEYVSEPLVRYHIHSNESIGKNPQKRLNGQLRLCEKNKEYLDSHREASWSRKIVLVSMYAYNGERKKAFATWLKAVKKAPKHVLQNSRALAIVIKTLMK